MTGFVDRSEKFRQRFVASRNLERRPRDLMSIWQGKDESLRDYISRFSTEAKQVTDCDDKLISIALSSGLRPGEIVQFVRAARKSLGVYNFGGDKQGGTGCRGPHQAERTERQWKEEG